MILIKISHIVTLRKHHIFIVDKFLTEYHSVFICAEMSMSIIKLAMNVSHLQHFDVDVERTYNIISVLKKIYLKKSAGTDRHQLSRNINRRKTIEADEAQYNQ